MEMLVHLGDIPAGVRKAAADLISDQKNVPVSPMTRTVEGRVELCAAAALLVANFDNQSDRDLLVSSLDKQGNQGLSMAFFKNGWSDDLCQKVRLANDSLNPATRKEGVLALLSPAPETAVE